MKTFKQFVIEAKQAKPDAPEKITSAWERRYPGMKAHLTHHHADTLKIHSLGVPVNQRRKGIASRFMKGVGNYADKQNKRVVLSPSADKGYKKKLDTFYRNFGFKPNKGRNKDFTVSDTMIRNPKN